MSLLHCARTVPGLCGWSLFLSRHIRRCSVRGRPHYLLIYHSGDSRAEAAELREEQHREQNRGDGSSPTNTGGRCEIIGEPSSRSCLSKTAAGVVLICPIDFFQSVIRCIKMYRRRLTCCYFYSSDCFVETSQLRGWRNESLYNREMGFNSRDGHQTYVKDRCGIKRTVSN